MKQPVPNDLTRLLQNVEAAQQPGLSTILPLVYRELHDLAERTLRGERPDHTLQPTALLNEAYIRLANHEEYRWETRSHFIAVAATLMRRILVDHARAKGSQKRGGQRSRIALDEAALPDEEVSVDLQALDEALARLAAM